MRINYDYEKESYEYNKEYAYGKKTVSRELKRNKHTKNSILTKNLILFLTLVIVCTTLIFTITTKTSAKTNDSQNTQRIFNSIQIEEGDTLWSIAEEYKPEGISTKEYIKELKKINGISTDNIHAGNYLSVYSY